jgi:hypothetical protein
MRLGTKRVLVPEIYSPPLLYVGIFWANICLAAGAGRGFRNANRDGAHDPVVRIPSGYLPIRNGQSQRARIWGEPLRLMSETATPPPLTSVTSIASA